ncbi:hypothetical protein HHX47_DHR5001114 [Lentinula edodes]|nr:hypothetical protein HHX47_DHR5001114 [Lentinula edodes]
MVQRPFDIHVPNDYFNLTYIIHQSLVLVLSRSINHRLSFAVPRLSMKHYAPTLLELCLFGVLCLAIPVSDILCVFCSGMRSVAIRYQIFSTTESRRLKF